MDSKEGMGEGGIEASGTLWELGHGAHDDQEFCDTNSIFVNFSFNLQSYRCVRVPG